MPHLLINGCQLYYEEHGKGPETILFSHGLLWSGKMFAKQVEVLKADYRVITYDHRGQGQSEVTPSGYGMDQLYQDAVQLIDTLELGPVHMAGLSMGGFVGMRVAARRPDLVRSLILMETSAEPEPNRFKYQLLSTIVRFFGVGPVVSTVMDIMFGDKFLKDTNRTSEREYWASQLRQLDRSITKAVGGVILRKGVEDELGNIQCPTLILVGTDDKATAPPKSEFIHQHIPHSDLIYVERGGHTSCVEEPEAYNRAISAFLTEPVGQQV